MLNITSYVLYNLSNLLFILLIPDSFAKLFLSNYSVASGIFIFLAFNYFSKKPIFSDKLIIITSVISIFLLEFFDFNIQLIWLFTFLVIYSDYFFSQRKNHLINFIFKLLLLLSSLFLYDNYFSGFVVLKIKIVIIILTLIYYNFFCKRYDVNFLKIQFPIIYTFLNSLIYFSSLYLIAILIPENFLKISYISFQILIGIQLKLFDLEIRNFKIKHKIINIMFGAFSILYLIFLGIFTQLYLIIIFYIFIFLSLNFIKKKYV